MDKNLSIGKPPLCGLAFRRPRSGRIRSQLSRIRGSKTYLYNQFPYARKISRKSKKGKPSPSPSNRKRRRLNCFLRYFPVLDRGEIIRNNQMPKGWTAVVNLLIKERYYMCIWIGGEISGNAWRFHLFMIQFYWIWDKFFSVCPFAVEPLSVAFVHPGGVPAI